VTEGDRGWDAEEAEEGERSELSGQGVDVCPDGDEVSSRRGASAEVLASEEFVF